MFLPRLAIPVATLVMALSACVENSSADATTIDVESSDTACDVSVSSAPAGTITFVVSNTGSGVTEFYFLAKDGNSIVGEVENIAPGLSRELTVTVEAGDYVTECEPGNLEEEVGTADFTVTD